MNKDIKRLATTLRKGLRNFLGIEQDSEALLGLLDIVTERQKELVHESKQFDSNALRVAKFLLSEVGISLSLKTGPNSSSSNVHLHSFLLTTLNIVPFIS